MTDDVERLLVVVVAAAADLRERTWRHARLHSSRARDESQI